MKVLTLLFALWSWCAQDTSEVTFMYKGKTYAFDLPTMHYDLQETNYTEGTYRIYKFENGGRMLLHVGGDVRKPILKSRDYIVEQRFDSAGIFSRRGSKSKSKRILYWYELSTCGNEITLLFDDVEKEDLKIFEQSINSLEVR